MKEEMKDIGALTPRVSPPAEKEPSRRKLVQLTPEMAAAVDEYRWGNRIGGESKALRQLINLGLDALKP